MEAEVIEANGSDEPQDSKETPKKDEPEPLRISVTEKVIFCIDAMVFWNCDSPVKDIFEILMSYINMKRGISIKRVEFKCLIFCNNMKVSQSDINDERDLLSTLMSTKNCNIEEEYEEFDFNVVFNALAKTIELPHPILCTKSIPPPWVYHCIMIFGHNLFPPIMKETNAFDFLIQSPFFAFDTVYIYNNTIEKNKCEVIGNALNSLYDVMTGYFYVVNCYDVDKQYNVFMQLLGHPLIRKPQNRAKFNFKDLIMQRNNE